MASLDVKDLKVLSLVNGLFTDATNYRQYRLLKKSGRYDKDVDHELSHMTKNVAVHMKDRTFGFKDTVSNIAFLQDFKAACIVCNIHEGVALWLLK